MNQGFLLLTLYLNLSACFPSEFEDIRYQEVSDHLNYGIKHNQAIKKEERSQSVFK